MLGQELAQQALEWVLVVAPLLSELQPHTLTLVLILAAIAIGQVTSWALRLAIHFIAHADDFILARLQQPLAWLVISILLRLAIVPLQLSGPAYQLIANILTTTTIVLAAWVLTRLTSALLTSWHAIAGKRSKIIADDAVIPLFNKFVAAFIWTGAFVSVLAAWGLAIGPLLAGLGLAGIAIGFAVKDSLANIFGGISLALDRAYKVGDKVRLQDGTVGVIHEMSLRSTRIRTFDGDLVMVPNGKVSNDNIYTFTQPSVRSRVSVDFSVVYGTRVKKAREAVLKAINKLEGIEEEPAPAVHFQEMGDSGLALRLNFWVAHYEQSIPKKREATQAIYDALNKAKIDFAFPTRTLYMKKQ